MIDWLRQEREPPHVVLDGITIPIVLRRNARTRRMTLRLAPDGNEVRVTLPSWGRTADAVAFARSRREWLEAQLARIPVPVPPMPGGEIQYRGMPLRIVWSPELPRTPRVSEFQMIEVGGTEASLAGRLHRWLERQALHLMAEDLAFYCTRAAITLPPLRLSRAQRRWGSCSGDGTIRLNWRLIQAPDAVRRSVVAHEVAHLVHFDHSPAFHALLGSLFDCNLDAANAWLKREGRSLYAAFG